MTEWAVYFKGKEIDTVWYTDDCDESYVLISLINYDGYPSNITVCRIED